jgi:glucosyl-3-phosphoglycerate phosphatase
MKKLYCIRHGTSLHNVMFHQIGRRAYNEYRDTPLLEEGIHEAKKLNENWDKIDDIELVIVSPLSRTIETALHVFKNKHIPMISIDSIMEHPQAEELCNMRLPKEELIEKYTTIDFSLLSDDHKLYWVPVFERKNEVERLNSRIAEFQSFVKMRPEKTIAIVSHSSFLGQMIFQKIGDSSCELRHCYPYEYHVSLNPL